MNRKKSRLPAVLLAIALAFAGIGAGYAFGRYSGQFMPRQIKDFVRDKVNKSSDGRIAPDVDINPVPSLDEGEDDGYETSRIYEMVSPSVVSVNVYGRNSVSPISGGTGIIMSRDGYIITNAHVVDGGSSVNVVLNDSKQLRGTIVGSDEDTDLAVIKVSASNLTRAEFGDSGRLKIGERVVAIGNAGGLSGTCTQGIISGLARDVDSNARALRLIQTSAAINPGNSGGPLINRFGQVIGITSSKIANVDYEGIGFAIPITEALPIVRSLIENGYVTGRRALGVQVIELNESNGPINGLPSRGIYIASINDGSDLGRKGVRERDVITSIDDEELTSTDRLMEILARHSPGDVVKLGVYRPETRQDFTVNVVLVESK